VNDGAYASDDEAFTTLVLNTPLTTMESGALPVADCNDVDACNYDATATGTSECTYATTWYEDTDGDGAGDPDTTLSACDQPAGYVSEPGDNCPTDVNKTEPGVCGCGATDVDADSDGIIDCNDNCTNVSAPNYDDPSNGTCDSADDVAEAVGACNGGTLELNLDNLHGYGSGATYSLVENLTGFASGTLSGNNLTIDFSGSGLGQDTIVVYVTATNSGYLKIPVEEYGYPKRIYEIIIDPASSPGAYDGCMLFNFTNHYDEPLVVYLDNNIRLNTVNNMLVLPHGVYHILGYENVKGCYNPEPAIYDDPAETPSIRRIVVPCVRNCNQ
jgi:hypothetical protein